MHELNTHAAAAGFGFSSADFSFPLGSSSFFGSATGAGVDGAAGAAAAGVLDGEPVVGLSRLNTLLIRLTYLPKLLRRSTLSLASEGPGADMLAASAERW